MVLVEHVMFKTSLEAKGWPAAGLWEMWMGLGSTEYRGRLELLQKFCLVPLGSDACLLTVSLAEQVKRYILKKVRYMYK
jgi:hypothetical protein